MDQSLDELTPEQILADIRYVRGLIRKAEQTSTAETRAAKTLFLRVIARLEQQLAASLEAERPNSAVG